MLVYQIVPETGIDDALLIKLESDESLKAAPLKLIDGDLRTFLKLKSELSSGAGCFGHKINPERIVPIDLDCALKRIARVKKWGLFTIEGEELVKKYSLGIPGMTGDVLRASAEKKN